MNTRENPTKRVEKRVVNEEVPPREEQVYIVNQKNEVPVVPLDMTHDEVRGVFLPNPKP